MKRRDASAGDPTPKSRPTSGRHTRTLARAADLSPRRSSASEADGDAGIAVRDLAGEASSHGRSRRARVLAREPAFSLPATREGEPVLTVRQPWASAILRRRARKDVENQAGRPTIAADCGSTLAKQRNALPLTSGHKSMACCCRTSRWKEVSSSDAFDWRRSLTTPTLSGRRRAVGNGCSMSQCCLPILSAGGDVSV